jgi:phosphohistidine phosphatase
VKRLIVVRHAKAEKAEAHRSDFERPLAGRGRRDAAEMGHRLARRGIQPDAVVSSPAPRALETARIVARELDFPWSEIQLRDRAYEAGGREWLSLLRELHDPVQCAMIVGHNPGLTELVQTLVTAFSAQLPTAAVAVLDLAVDSWATLRAGSGSLLLFDSPKSDI